MIDKLIDSIIHAVFSKLSLLLHVIFCAAQFALHVDENLITNIISWEAIFLALMIGIQQYQNHANIKKHLALSTKEIST